MAGNPNFIAAAWGEETKAFKLPVRLGKRIQELKEKGENADDILDRLNCDRAKSLESNLSQVAELLQSALLLKSNAAGGIKVKIRQVLQLLSTESE